MPLRRRTTITSTDSSPRRFPPESNFRWTFQCRRFPSFRKRTCARFRSTMRRRLKSTTRFPSRGLPATDTKSASTSHARRSRSRAELRVLWTLAERLAKARGKADVVRIDYTFRVDWDAAGVNDEPGRVSIVPRPRGSPLDKLVAELMIHVNNTWGRLLADNDAPGLYRVQSNGKVKMSTRAGEHQGLGLSHYLWASSPLRRYSDLVNQRQLLAAVEGRRPPYGANDAELFAVLADFEATYSQYAEFQNRMEHYWCLRWLLQENVTETGATVIRENLVRFERLPLILRLADLPALAADTRVRVAIARVDLLA